MIIGIQLLISKHNYLLFDNELFQLNFRIYNQKECIIQKEGSNVGDVLQLVCDVITNKFKLLRNGQEVCIQNMSICLVFGWFMVLNAIFNNISVLLVEETGVPGENHRPVCRLSFSHLNFLLYNHFTR